MFLDMLEKLRRRLFEVQHFGIWLLRLKHGVPISLDATSFRIEDVNPDSVAMRQNHVEFDGVAFEAQIEAEDVVETLAAERDLLDDSCLAADIAAAAEQKLVVLFIGA